MLSDTRMTPLLFGKGVCEVLVLHRNFLNYSEYFRMRSHARPAPQDIQFRRLPTGPVKEEARARRPEHSPAGQGVRSACCNGRNQRTVAGERGAFSITLARPVRRGIEPVRHCFCLAKGVGRAER